MEHVILSLISIAILLSSGMMIAQTAVLSADQFSTKWREMEVRAEDLASTKVAATSARYTSGQVEVTLENQGQRVLGDFPDWDVVVQYYDASNMLFIRRLEYVSGTVPGDDQWVVYAIQHNGSSEIFQPGLLDPGEQLILRMQLLPTLGNNRTILVVISTPNGVTTSIQFKR